MTRCRHHLITPAERTLALLWRALAESIDARRATPDQDRRAFRWQAALRDHIAGVRAFTGLPLVTVIAFLAKHDPTIAQRVAALNDAQLRAVVNELVPSLPS